MAPKIIWTDEEIKLVGDNYKAIRNQCNGEGDALSKAQLVLPIERRRPTISSMSQAKKVAVYLGVGVKPGSRSKPIELTADQLETIATSVAIKLSAILVKIEKQLLDLQQQIGKTKQSQEVKAPVDDRSTRMPVFLLAGGDRSDFQRLQNRMANAGIRLIKIDTSAPRHVMIPPHDRIIVWTSRLSSELQVAVRSKANPAKIIAYAGVFDDLAPLIAKEITVVRDERKRQGQHVRTK